MRLLETPSKLSLVGVVHLVEFSDEVPSRCRANAALDAFHCTIPVGNLDDFEFLVFDPDGEAEILPEDEDGYSYSDGVFL